MRPVPDEPLTIVLNPRSGRGGRNGGAEAIRAALDAAGVAAEVLQVAPEALADVARRAARGGRTVGVGGGDGTLSGVAEAISRSDGVLAPFPLGTRNHFARRLGIESVDAAVRALRDGREARLALGWVGGRPFINHASAGFYPRVVFHRERIRRWTGKAAGNLLSAMYVLARLEPLTVALEVDGERHRRTVPGLWVAPGRGAFRLPVDGVMPEGDGLEVVLPRTKGRLQLVSHSARALWHLRRGHPLEVAGMEVLRVSSFTLQARQPLDLSRDGEVERVHPPIEFSLEPRALRVLTLADERA